MSTREARRAQATADLLDDLLDDTAHVPAALTLADVRDRATLRVDEAAQVMQVSTQTAYREVREGRWPVIRQGRAIRIAVPALRRLLGDLD